MPRSSTQRTGTPLDSPQPLLLPPIDLTDTGVAMVGDTKAGDLCRAKVFVSEGVVVEVELTVIGDQEILSAGRGLISYLRGRPYSEVLAAVTARSCSSDGCSSVDGHCFSLVQEAIYRALGDFASRHGAPPLFVTAPAGAVDLTRREVPPIPLPDPVEPTVQEWARSRMIKEP